MPRKLRQLVTDLERAGFQQMKGGKGSHRKFRHDHLRGKVMLCGADGDDAKHYQEQQVRNAISKLQQ